MTPPQKFISGEIPIDEENWVEVYICKVIFALGEGCGKKYCHFDCDMDGCNDNVEEGNLGRFCMYLCDKSGQFLLHVFIKTNTDLNKLRSVFVSPTVSVSLSGPVSVFLFSSGSTLSKNLHQISNFGMFSEQEKHWNWQLTQILVFPECCLVGWGIF